jgi:quercetin dioxygenase-like cupin family protein
MDVVDVRPLGASLQSAHTTTLVKTDQLELIRLVLPEGKSIAEHAVDGEITVQCLEGSVEFRSNDLTRVLAGGQLVYLTGGSKHSVRAVTDASLLITILLNR